jgi:O-antigen/teichoic acid export membrane protein
MKSAARRLVSGSATRMITLVVRIGIGLFMVPFMIHGLGDRAYGLWALVGVVVGYYGMLDLGLSQALGRYVARALARDDLEESNRLVNTGFLIYSLLGLLVFLAALAFAALSPVIWSDRDDASLFAPLILILGLNLALGFPVRAFGGILQAKLRHDLASRFSLVTLILHAALIIWALESGYGLIMVATVTLLGGIPEKALTIYYGVRELPSLQLSRRFARADTARTLFSFSFYLFISRVSQLLRFQTDAIILSAFVGLVAVTHYRVASTLIRYYREMMIACFGALLPFFSVQDGRGDTQGLERTFLFSTRISVSLAAFVTFGLIAWGQPFIVRWVGDAYLDAYPCLVVLALAALIRLSQSTFPTLLLSSGREKMSASLAAAEGVTNILLALALVQQYGMLGVAIGSLVASIAVRLVAQPALGCQVLEISYAHFLLHICRTALRAALCLLPAYLLTRSFSTPGYLGLGAVGAASGGFYALGIWFIEFNRAEREMLLRVLIPSHRKARTSRQSAPPQ